MSKPQRIQRRRAKGWRMPEGVVYVGRGSKWGNPFVVGVDGTRAECLQLYRLLLANYLCVSRKPEQVEAQERAHAVVAKDIAELRGKTLACWCPLSVDCHADVLLELANAELGVDDRSSPHTKGENS